MQLRVSYFKDNLLFSVFFLIMKILISIFNWITGVKLSFDDSDTENWAVLIVTPVMLRAQESTQASEIIFIDSTSSVECSQSTLTVVLTASPAGAVPIGVLIHNTQSTVGYTKAFALLKQNFPNCFGGKSVSKLLLA